MPDRVIFTNEGARNEASVLSLSIANPDATPTPTKGKLRLFTSSFVPNITNVKADFVAAETTLGGYPTGGYDIDSLIGPSTANGGGALLTLPLVNVAYTISPGDTIGGGWIEDAGGAVRGVQIFDPPRPLQAIGDGFPMTMQFVYDRNQ